MGADELRQTLQTSKNDGATWSRGTTLRYVR
jgi:hypothetical protein